MREILFRAKRVDNGEWVYGDLSQIQCRVYISQFVLDDTYRDGAENKHLYKHIWVFPSTVGQYTGLTDKNGKKIFEGDILKPPCWYWHIYRCVCIYREEHQTGSIQGFGLYHKINDWVELVDTDEWDEFEVIGNIHDNPELLEAD